MEEILRIENFKLAFHGPRGRVPAVHEANLSVHAGETVAIVGESGSGKTSLCRCILMLHASHASIEAGRIFLMGRDVTNMTESELERVRGRDASMIFQDPLSSLNPVFSIGQQITTPLMMHRGMDRASAEEQSQSLLAEMGFENPAAIMKQYPHQLSGGMRQRVAIAIALSCDPKLIIADEPTTALDMDTQGKIMELFQRICANKNRAVIFVSHDLGLAQDIADRIVVMKDGRIIEEGPTAEIFQNPQQEYTKSLIRYAQYGKGTGHKHGALHDRADRFAGAPAQLTVSHLTKSFAGRPPVLSDFSMTIRRGEILGIVGPSGCGKSTLARCIMGIHSPDSGFIGFAEGTKAQMIFQDSDAALNPRMTIGDIIAEPLVIGRFFPRKKTPEIRQKVLAVMEQVELSEELIDRHPYDVSGGQRQRAAIARALITDPDFIIADEPISSLDVTIQAQIIHLLRDLRDKRNLTMLLIAHDLPMVEHVSDRIITL